MTTRIAATMIMFSLIPACAQEAGTEFPRQVAEIPSEFHGRWDEITEDGCDSRESRFALEPRSIHNFEVAYAVVKVILSSPLDINVHTRLEPEFGGPADEVWHFRLVQGGQALSAPDGKPPFYKRCPKLPAPVTNEEDK